MDLCFRWQVEGPPSSTATMGPWRKVIIFFCLLLRSSENLACRFGYAVMTNGDIESILVNYVLCAEKLNILFSIFPGYVDPFKNYHLVEPSLQIIEDCL